MKNLFAQLVAKLVNYHFDEEKRHWEELNPSIAEGSWLGDVPGTEINRTDRFCLKTQFNGRFACIIDIPARKSVLLQGDDATQVMDALSSFAAVPDELFDQFCSDYTEVMQPEPSVGDTDPHIYDDLVKLKNAYPVTLEKAMGDNELHRSLCNLLCYDRDTEADDFSSMFDLGADPDDMPLDSVLGYHCSQKPIRDGIVDAMGHIYQVIRYLENELDTAAG